MGRSNAAHEPSMEEILASIRKIIESGDERPGEGALRRAVAPDVGPRLPRPPAAPAAPNEATADQGGLAEAVAAHPEEADLPAVARAHDAVAERDLEEASNDAAVADATDHFFDLDFSDLKIELEQEFEAENHLNGANVQDWDASPGRVEPVSRTEPTAPRPAAQPFPVFDDEGRADPAAETWAGRSDGRHAALRAAATVAVDRQAASVPRFEVPAASVQRPVPATATVAAEPLSAASPQALSAANSDDRRLGEFRSAVMEDAGRLPPAVGPQLLSERSGEMVGASFEELTRAIRDGQLRSMEEMAEDLMRPMLQEWLDDNLPKLVERLVREEIERVARGGR